MSRADFLASGPERVNCQRSATTAAARMSVSQALPEGYVKEDE